MIGWSRVYIDLQDIQLLTLQWPQSFKPSIKHLSGEPLRSHQRTKKLLCKLHLPEAAKKSSFEQKQCDQDLPEAATTFEQRFEEKTFGEVKGLNKNCKPVIICHNAISIS